MLLFQFAAMPWWATVIGVVTGIALGVLGALPWRSAAGAANAERDSLRETRNRLIEENTNLKAEVAVLKARTDLDGLRAEMIKSMTEMREEFQKHSDQDFAVAKEHVEAMAMVNSTLKMLREQMRK